MKFPNSTLLAVVIFTITTEQQELDKSEITGYHFHTYFFQNNINSIADAQLLRLKIHELSDTQLAGCRLNHLNLAPIGPHVIGQFETCCNSSAVSSAQSFFMQNHGNLSILLHPLTRYEVLDHTERAMWLGGSILLDISTLTPDVIEPQKCLPLDGVIP